MSGVAREEGVAMLLAMMALLLMSAIGAALVLTSSTETLIASHFRDSVEGRYAAGAIIERALDGIGAAPDWAPLIAGTVASPWVDGAPSGVRTLRDGSTIDLAQVINRANCQKATTCSTAELRAVTPDRPWGANNPEWRLYAFGPLRDLLGGSAWLDSPYYAVLLVGAGTALPEWEVLALRSEAFGPRGAHAVVEATAGRSAGAVRILSWRALR